MSTLDHIYDGNHMEAIRESIEEKIKKDVIDSLVDRYTAEFRAKLTDDIRGTLTQYSFKNLSQVRDTLSMMDEIRLLIKYTDEDRVHSEGKS
jgi:hypothetical protein